MMVDFYGEYGLMYTRILSLIDEVMQTDEAINVREALVAFPPMIFVIAMHFVESKQDLTWDNLFFIVEGLVMKGAIASEIK